MVKDAEMHAEEDRQEKERAEALNEADNLIYVTEKSLKDYGDKISADERSKIEEAVEDLKKAVEAKNLQDMKSKIEALKQASYKLAEEVYKTASQEAQKKQAAGAEASGDAGDANTSAAGDAGAADGENVEDADYEVVDEDNSKK
jgi:molecular chaperone DnaK